MFGIVVFSLGVVALLVGIVGFFTARDSYGDRHSFNWVFPVIGLVLFGLFGASTTMVTVGARQDGVVTSFKKPTGEVLDSGLSFTAPWESVEEMDAANQTTTYVIDVQMAGGAKAKIDVYPSWRIADGAASDLYQDYKSFDNVVASLWEQQLRSTANIVFGTYNPLTNVDAKTGELKKTKQQWADELKTALENNPLIKGKLIINSLSIPTILPDEATQNSLNQIVAEFAKGSVLEQQKANALKQKEITETNAKVDKVTRCLEIAEKAGKEPGLCMGSGAGVIINTTK